MIRKARIAACLDIHFETIYETINPDDRIKSIFDILKTIVDVPNIKTSGTNEANGLCVCGRSGGINSPKLYVFKA